VPEPPSADQPDLDALFRLREDLQKREQQIDATLKAFYVEDTGGFVHQLVPDKPKAKVLSKASTATCLALLHDTGRLDDRPWVDKRADLVEEIVKEKEWNSARLGADNPFTVSFLLEAVANLRDPLGLTGAPRTIVDEKVCKLRQQIADANPEPGGVALQDYEATAFLTYKAVVALKRWDALEPVRDAVTGWTWQHLSKECLLVASESQDADVFEVAYSALIASAIVTPDRMTPQQRGLLREAVGQFFRHQRPDGSWPRSRPLFVYPRLGHAYCYDYELLAALLSDAQLAEIASEHLGCLHAAAQALEERKYPLSVALDEADGERSEPVYGWSSGHHGTKVAAESWATAAALHFCSALSRLVAERIRRETFEYVGASYTPPSETDAGAKALDGFLDSPLAPGGDAQLKTALEVSLLSPLLAVRAKVRQGKTLPKRTSGGVKVPTSAILFGPPGTSKTGLAERIGEALGWPVLALDPSHLTRHGLDAVHSEANKLFGMLQRCEEVVVLLDEFDELMREREGGSDMESRFLTTAMLPKLAALSRERRIVYLVATNHLEQFDAAIRRPGRFDMVIPVLPPTASEKLERFEPLRDALPMMDLRDRRECELGLEDLIYLEAEDLVDQVAGIVDGDALAEQFENATAACTMNQPVNGKDGETWKRRMDDQAKRVRGLRLSA
jgi:hypothetical protein